MSATVNEDTPAPEKPIQNGNAVNRTESLVCETPNEDESCIKPNKSHTRDLDQVTREMRQTLSGLNTPEEKIVALCKKYADLLADHRELQSKIKTTTKKHTQVQREKDRLQLDHNKAILAKTKLESLCRELQKQNKLIKDESLKRSREDEHKRQDVSEKFKNTIDEVHSQMAVNQKINERLQVENEELRSKIKELLETYQEKMIETSKQLKSSELEGKLLEAKLAESNILLAEEKKKMLLEKQMLMAEYQEKNVRCELLTTQEAALKKQLTMYSEKFDDFQKNLSKSNKVFSDFKTEMGKMSKRIKALERDITIYKTKLQTEKELYNRIKDDKEKLEQELGSLKRKNTRLESLCRSMQEEQKKLNDANRKLKQQLTSGMDENPTSEQSNDVSLATANGDPPTSNDQEKEDPVTESLEASTQEDNANAS